MRAFEHRHIVSFRDTNLVGNVYFSNFIDWQGRCREMFLKEHVPTVMSDLADGLLLVTKGTRCDYFDELHALDEVLIRMTPKDLGPSRLTMSFDYFRVSGDDEQLIARGEQQVVSMRRNGGHLAATPLPEALREAVRSYMD